MKVRLTFDVCHDDSDIDCLYELLDVINAQFGSRVFSVALGRYLKNFKFSKYEKKH